MDELEGRMHDLKFWGLVITTYGKSRGPQTRPEGTRRPQGSGSAQRKANRKGFSYNPNQIH